MGYLGNKPADSYLTLEKQTFTTSATDTYTLDREVSSVNDIELFLNNVRQEPTEAYTISGTTLTLASAITASDSLYCIYQGRAVGTQSPASGSVTNDMLSSGSFSNITGTGTLTNFTSTGIDDNADSTAITINSSEQVIIGGTTPENSSVVLEAQDATNPILQVKDTTSNIICGIQAGNSSAVIRCPQNNPLVFGVGSGEEERMRIDSSGKVAIGSTSPNRQFNVHSTGIPCARFQREQGDNALRTHLEFIREGNSVGEIQCTNTSTSYATSSDHRLKENVIDLADATTRVKQLQPKRFNFIADANTTVDGFLAHEVSSIVPEAITGTHNEVDEDGNPVYQGIDQSKLVPLLTASLKEAIAKIEELETRLETLENA